MAVVTEQSKEIDGTTYTTKIFPATEGLDLIQWLTKVLGASLLELVLRLEDDEAADLLANLAGGAVDNEIITAMAATVVKVAERAEPGDISSLFKATLARTKFVPAEGQPAAPVESYFDEHFAGRYMHLVNVFIWVVRVSFVRP